MAERKHAKDELVSESRVEGIPKGGLTCVGDICYTADGKLEVHLNGDNPLCARLTEVIAPKLMLGIETHYVVDPPKASPAARKR